MMKKILALAAVAASFGLATPAAAAVTVNTGFGTTVLTAGVPGSNSTTINYQGMHDGTLINGLLNRLQLTLTSQSATQAVFAFTLTNNSTLPITAATVSAFGFDVDPNVSGASITSTVFNGTSSGNIANGRSVELCFTAGPNCAGGASNGVDIGGSTSGTFTLNFTGNAGDITLSNLNTRILSIAGAGNVTSATGITTAVPEPGTWALMLIGFGAMGVSLRRSRRKQGFLPQAA